jgi:general secretion pathway protein L
MSDEERSKTPEEVGGIWFLDDDGLTNLASSDVGSATVLVPTEQVLILLADLPLPSRRQRLSALPFAIEDQLADPIGDVHIALGEEVAPRRHIAGAVRHGVMAAWVDKVMKAGLTHCAIVPDALSLPVPDAGAWVTQVSGDRVLVRTSDGTGFATSLAQLPALWAAAGNPICITHAEPLPDEITSVPGTIELGPLTERLMVPELDLRQGIYAKPRRPVPLSARKVLAVIAAGFLAHAVIAILDTFALHSIAEERRAEAQLLVQQYLPGVTVNGEFAAEVNELLVGGGGPARSRFIPLLVRSSGALGQARGGTALSALSYEGRTGELTLQVEQPDLVSLERMQGALAAAGLNPVSGATTVQNNIAGSRIVVREVAAGTAP